LNEGFSGGETIFPRAAGDGAPSSLPGMSECSQGLAVRPSLGAAALFYSQTPRGSQDATSSHGGCPPLGEGDVKYGANAFSWSVPATWGYHVWQPTWNAQ
jgi:hypothetical protein